MKIAINEILGESICSYRGPLSVVAEDIDALAMEDIRQESENGIIYADHSPIFGTYYKVDDLQPEWNWKKGYLEEQCEDLMRGRDDDLKNTLKKYGIIVKGFSIYKPRFYNYEQDSLDMEIETEPGNRKEQYPELIEHVQYYIDNKRKKSCDGYISYEPDKIDEIEKNDYAYIWAVLCHEYKLEDFAEDLRDNINSVIENCREYIDDMQYQILKDDKRYYYKYNRDRACLELVEEK